MARCGRAGQEAVEIAAGDGDPGDDVAEEPASADVPRGDVGADALEAVLVLDPHGVAEELPA